MNHKIKFYSVDNGDTTLITLTDKTTILVDCKMRASAEDPEITNHYDLKNDLLVGLEKREKNPFVDLFILTHPDKDHCHGFSKNFYTGNPDNYKKENLDNDEIIIDEMWVTSMLFHGASSDDAKAFKKEAERRRKLWDDNHADKDKSGNKIRMIGYDGNDKFKNVPASVPGEFIRTINGKTKNDFELFVHSPFKKNLITAITEQDNNYSSIVMQARFKFSAKDRNFSNYFLFGGDANHDAWEQILSKSKSHEHEEELKWDIFMAPHHCSWIYFNDVPYEAKEENKIPKESSLEILDYKSEKGKIIASSKVIKNNDDNPPHYKAKQEYLKKLDNKEDFLNTANEPNQNEPEPIEFEITETGFKRVDKGVKVDALRQVAEGIKTGLLGTASSGKIVQASSDVATHQPHRFYGK